MPAGAVRAIFSAIDFSKDGSSDILVGRDDGSVELYGMDTEQQPTLLWSINVSESVSSIQGGFITSPSTQVRGADEPQGRPARQEAVFCHVILPIHLKLTLVHCTDVVQASWAPHTGTSSCTPSSGCLSGQPT